MVSKREMVNLLVIITDDKRSELKDKRHKIYEETYHSYIENVFGEIGVKKAKAADISLSLNSDARNIVEKKTDKDPRVVALDKSLKKLAEFSGGDYSTHKDVLENRITRAQLTKDETELAKYLKNMIKEIESL